MQKPGVILLFLCFWQVALFSSNQLESTRMEVSLEELSERIIVRVVCRVRLDSEVKQIPVRVISQEHLAIENIRVILQGKESPLSLIPINSKVAKGIIEGIFEATTDSLLEIVITYELPGIIFRKKSTTVTIPLIFIDWKPEAASAEAFTSRVSIPDGYAIQSIFPAMLWAKETKGNSDTYSFELQTIPAWVKFILYEGAPPFITLELVIDLGVILVLIILILVGWKKFRNG